MKLSVNDMKLVGEQIAVAQSVGLHDEVLKLKRKLVDMFEAPALGPSMMRS